MNEKLKKNAIWNTIGTGINSFASLFFLIIVTRINNIDEAGIFTYAFSTAILLNVIGTYAGRIYQVTERKKISNNDFLINRLITCALMIIIAIIFIFIKRYNSYKTTVVLLLCFLKLLEAFCDVIYGFLQREDNLYKVGISYTLKNVIGILGFLLVNYITKNMIISIIVFICIFLLVTVFYDFKESKIILIIKEDKNKKNIFDILKNGFPIFCVTFLNMYLINASKYSMDGIMEEKYQAIFGIIIMPATMMVLIAQFLIHPFLNIISDYIVSKKYKELNVLQIKIGLLLLLFGILGIAFCYFIGIYILEFIYGIELIDYNLCLSIILVGSIFSALISMITTVLIAMRYTLIQMIVYGAVSLLILFISKLLILNYGIMGASINYTISMFLTFCIFLIVYFIVVKKEKKREKV